MFLLISVIVPVYNTGNLLCRCVDSILQQTYPKWELILVDDGSDNKTSELCNIYANRDSRIIVKHKQNGGVSSARNEGLKIAKGEWIGFMDSDDSISNDTLQAVATCVIQNTKLELIRIPGFYFYGAPNQHIKTAAPVHIVGKNKVISYLYQNRRNEVWSYFIRKDLMEGVYFDTSVKIGEDILFLMNIWNRTSNAFITNQGMYYYYYAEGSAMDGVKEKKYITDSLLLDKIVSLYNDKKTWANIAPYFTDSYSRGYKGTNENMSRRVKGFLRSIGLFAIITCNLNVVQKTHLILCRFNLYKYIRLIKH